MKNELMTTSNAAETVTISRAEYEELKQENERLQQESAELTRTKQWLMEQLNLAKRNRFGAKTDTVSEETMDQMSMLFDEAEATEWIETEREKKDVSVAAHTRKHKSGAVKDIIPEGTPVEVEEHRLEGDDLLCPECGEQMVEIGKTVKQTLVFKPAQVIVREDWYYTYACKACEELNTQIVKTPKDATVLPGSFASPEAVAYIMTQKYVMGAPLYRQEQELKRRGIELSRQTMSNWVLKCAELWLTPVYDALHEKLKREEIVHADETTLQVLHEPGKKPQTKSFIWLYRTGKYAERPIVLYKYCSSRRQENPAEFLGAFTGYLQTDGYAGYNSLTNATHVGCFAHLRRKFTDAEKAAPKGKAGPTVVTALRYCASLVALEQQLAGSSCEERYTLRQEKAKPILDEFSSWVSTRSASPKSKLGEALIYAQNQLPRIRNYLLDGRLELTNNLAERSIKPFVIDRKNFLFANTPGGATDSAVTFSIIETAKENGLDPFQYLTYIFKTAPTLERSTNDWATPLLPENAPDFCKTK